MKYDDINNFILNYMSNDKTGTAVMLTAPWGYGKSFYIQHTLKPFLTNMGYQCVIVSLYGLRSVQEISKQIYLDLRTIHIFDGKAKKSELQATGKIIGKAFLNSVVSKIGIDFEPLNDSYLQELYESVDLTGKLIVLEDFERSEMSMVDILGYVNNLTEHDQVRILLVANEDELIKKKTQGEKKVTYSEETLTYLRYKEKTVGDTIKLSGDQTGALADILGEYKRLSNCILVEDIISRIGKLNLRTFKYACQKADEMLGYLCEITLSDATHLEQFRECIFFGILNLAISLSRNYDQASKWTGGKYYKGEDDHHVRILRPTNQVHLLFKFCFDFILDHEIPSEETIQETYNAYCNYCLYETNQTADDKDLSVIKYYYIHLEKDVKTAISNIAQRLKNEKEIPFTEYGDLARALIRIKYSLGIDVEDCKKYIIKNLRGKSNLVDEEAMFVFDVGANNSDEHKEYMELKESIIASLNEFDETIPFGFDYASEHFRNLEVQASQRNRQEDFVSKLNIEKLKEAIKTSSSEELDDLRGVLFSAYRSGVQDGYNTYYPISDNDREALIELKEFITHYNFQLFDKVQKFQLSMLAENITEMLDFCN